MIFKIFYVKKARKFHNYILIICVKISISDIFFIFDVKKNKLQIKYKHFFYDRAGIDSFYIKYTTRYWKLGNGNRKKRRQRDLNRAPNIPHLFIMNRIFLASLRTSVLDIEATMTRGKKRGSRRRMVNICGSHRKVNTIQPCVNFALGTFLCLFFNFYVII